MNDKAAENLNNSHGEKLPTQLSADEQNGETLEQLLRALDYTDGFAIFIARCNVPVQRRQFIADAKVKLASLNIHVLELTFDQSIRDLRSHLRQMLANNEQSRKLSIFNPQSQELALAEPIATYRATPTPVIFISGLEFSIPFDDPNAPMLSELNLGRELFRRDAPYPILFWLPDYAITAVARYAPDFWSWRSSVFEFESDEHLRSETVHLFTQDEGDWYTISNLSVEAKRHRSRLLESLLNEYLQMPYNSHFQSELADMVFSLGKIRQSLSEFDKALNYYQQALVIKQKLGDRLGEAKVLNNIGILLSNLGDKQSAMKNYEQSLSILQEIQASTSSGQVVHNIAAIYSALNDSESAYHYFQKALELFRDSNDQYGEAYALKNLASIFIDIGENQTALDYCEQALLIQRRIKDRSGESKSLTSIGDILLSQGNKQKALEYYEQAYLIEQYVGNRKGQSILLARIGNVNVSLGNQLNALESYKHALFIIQNLGDKLGERIAYINLGKIYSALGDLNKAECQLHNILIIDEAVHHPDLEKDRANLARLRQKLQQTPPGAD